MSNDNPFGNNYDDDKTVLRPMPGGRKSESQAAPTPPTHPSPVNVAGISDNLRQQISQSTHNPLTSAAISLLSLVSQLRNTSAHPDVTGLRVSMIEEIKQFDNKARNLGIPAEQAQAAKYALCTLLDETVLNTPWGCNSIWSTQSLLIFFHKESWGGEKFFLILKNCMQQPASNLDLLELLYFCLCLGFEGRYRVEDHGLSKLAEVRENVYQIIQRQRGDVERSLSLHWQGIKDKRNILAKFVPLWVIGSVAGLLLMLSFLAFFLLITPVADPLLAELYKLNDSFKVAPPIAVAQEIPAPSTAPLLLDKLNTFLEPEVRNHEVVLLNKDGKTVIRIITKGFFKSGSDQIMPDHLDLLNRIGQALATTNMSNHITVVGHTDNTPIKFNVKFPSNWDLSKARALSVLDTLSSNNKISIPMTAEGRADTQPMVPNDTPENKALNRRVEIIL